MSAAASQCHQSKDSVAPDGVKHEEACYPLTRLQAHLPHISPGKPELRKDHLLLCAGHVWDTETNGPAPPAFHSAQGMKTSSLLGRDSKHFQPRENLASSSPRHHTLFPPGPGWHAPVGQQTRLCPISDLACPVSACEA